MISPQLLDVLHLLFDLLLDTFSHVQNEWRRSVEIVSAIDVLGRYERGDGGRGVDEDGPAKQRLLLFGVVHIGALDWQQRIPIKSRRFAFGVRRSIASRNVSWFAARSTGRGGGRLGSGRSRSCDSLCNVVARSAV